MYFELIFIFAYVDRVRTLKIGDPNVCPKLVNGSNVYTFQKEFDIVCCPDYIYQNGKCEACPPGKFGPDCKLPCLTNYFGVQCTQMCTCTDNRKCDPRYGCVCNEGFIGKQCLDVCPQGSYGLNCTEECFCAQDAECDPVTGNCFCSAGWFGKHCTMRSTLHFCDNKLSLQAFKDLTATTTTDMDTTKYACTNGTYGTNCTAECMCSKDAQCDHVTGECVCLAGRFGDNCTNVCEPGTHGVNCNEECFCAHSAMCDPINGNCLCPAGLFGVHCTKKCLFGKYGINCSGICNCSNHEHCDVISGDCNSHTDTKVNGNSGNSVLVYIMMAAALTGLICVVALFVKAKEAIIRKVHKCHKNSSKPNIERRKAKRRLSSAPTEDAHTESSIIDTEISLFHNPMEEELYCEIEDIDDLKTDREEMNKH